MILGKPWTEAEDAIVRAGYLRRGAAAVARELERSFSATAKRARRLGIQSHKRWSKSDDAFLQDYWGHHPVATLAREMSRTRAAIYWRARKLDLDCGAPDGYEYLTHAAERTGYCASQLRRILAWRGVPLKVTSSRPVRGTARHYHMVDQVEVDEAVEAWLACEDVEPAALRHGIAGSTLKAWLLEAKASGFDVPALPTKAKARWRVPTSLVEEVVRWRRQLETLSEAARRTGMNRWRLRCLLLDAGVERRHIKPWLVERAVVDAVLRARRAA